MTMTTTDSTIRHDAVPGPHIAPGLAAAAPGGIAEADGNAALRPDGAPVEPAARAAALRALGYAPEEFTPEALGPNNERLEEAAPRLVAALRALVAQFRQESLVARRHEIRRIRQARLFWQGLQYAWWDAREMRWRLPWEASAAANEAAEGMPRYQFVTNLYQAFGLSFISVLSQDVPTTRFYPQSVQSEADIATARAASEVAALVEQNNRVQQMLTGVAFYLWTDGKIGGYVRYVADGQRFGWRDERVVEERWARLGSDAYVCPRCGAETEIAAQGDLRPGAAPDRGQVPQGPAQPAGALGYDTVAGAPAAPAPFLAGAMCADCGAALAESDFRPAPLVPVPVVVGTRRVPNGQEVISIVGGLELNTPVWASEQHEFPYLQWQMEVHRAKLRAAYPHAAARISGASGPAETGDEADARSARLAVAQGPSAGSGGAPAGDGLFHLVTFSRTWIRPWAFYSVEDAAVRDALLALFPDGCYVAFAGDVYCESRSESMDSCWRVMHALPGDGQNRPAVGDSLIEVQQRYNTLSNIQAETYEYGIPPIYADPQVLDFDALADQTAEPAAHYPARARPGMALADGFFQPAPAQVPPDMLRHQHELMGPIAQFLTGLFPAVFGGEMSGVRTATGYALARDQAIGRLGLVWRRLKQFYADLMLLSVECFRRSRPADVEIPYLGPGGEFQARFIRLADLRGNVQAHPEADETFPRLKSQQRAVVQQLLASPDPVIQEALSEPANMGFIKSLIGLSEMVLPGEDARNKQLREIQQLLAGAPVAVDELLDDHENELRECRRWARSDAGQAARAQNPAGFAAVRAHAAAHAAALVARGAASPQPDPVGQLGREGLAQGPGCVTAELRG